MQKKEITVPEIKSRKGFQSGNDLWKKGIEARLETKKRNMDVLLDVVAQGGVEQYANLMALLAQGQKITAPEREFLDRYEKLFPYKQAKLSSIEQKIEVKASPFGLGHGELQSIADTTV